MSDSDDTSASRRQNLDTMPGHRLLARMGKQVLRPGGRELTDELLSELSVGPGDHVVELAPGVGATAKLVFERNPSGYTGIERDVDAAAKVNARAKNYRYQCIVGAAHETHLANNSSHVVLCEAVLTMQSEENKKKVIDEAFRILRPGGRLGIHELCLRPESLDAETQDEVRGDLARSTQVGVRPLTAPDWSAMIKRAGFQISYESTVAMRLLEPIQLIKDEGFVGAARVVFNMIRTPVARRRILDMRRTFRQNSRQLGAVAIVAVKPSRPGPQV